MPPGLASEMPKPPGQSRGLTKAMLIETYAHLPLSWAISGITPAIRQVMKFLLRSLGAQDERTAPPPENNKKKSNRNILQSFE
jgi:hypothetical protein